MSEKEYYELLFLGDDIVIKKFSEYLGHKSKSQRSGIVYFEFPNQKFKNNKFQRLFKYRLKIYVCQPQLLTTILLPQKQFNTVDAIICVSDNNNDSLTAKSVDYLEKFLLSRKYCLPTLFIGYNKEENIEDWSLRKFYFNLEFRKIFQDVFGVKSSYLNMNENQNEALFFVRVKELLQSIEDRIEKKYSTIIIEQMLKDFRSKIKNLQEEPPNSGINLVLKLEQRFNITVTRRTLVKKWGLSNINARALMDYWEKRISIDEYDPEEIMLLEKESISKLKELYQFNLKPNLVNLISLGIEFTESKICLAFLKKMGEINEISYHLAPIEFEVYSNLQDIIIISEGNTIYIKTNEQNNDQITLFSGLIQTIEMVRNNYLKEKSMEMKEWLKVADVDFLEFGNLHCIIGTGNNGVKVILRFDERPQSIYIKKTKEFIDEFEKVFHTILHRKIINLHDIKPKIDELFYQYYNPFPQKIPFNKRFSLSNVKEIEPLDLTKIELEIIEEVNNQKEMPINEILTSISKNHSKNISESDLLQTIFDLVIDKILV